MKGFICLVFVVVSLKGFSQRDGIDVVVGKSYAIQSRVLGEKRNYAVYLPDGYNSKWSHPKKYPVIYLLDGEAHFHSVSGILDVKSSGTNGAFSLPEMIVVAIGNTNRMRDLSPTHVDSVNGVYQESFRSSGGGPAFLKFLKEELFVHIEKTYRTMPYRILIGHSLGGLLAVHALYEEPGMFNAYIAIDPSLWWDDKRYIRDMETLSKTSFGKKALFLAEANHPHLSDTVTHAAREFAEKMDEYKHDGLNWKYQYYERETHGSVPLVAEYDGLHFIFEKYSLPLELNPAPEELETHFRNFSDIVGLKFSPPEKMIVFLGYAGMHTKDYDKAVRYYQMAVDHYPQSYANHRNLGDAWRQKGDMQKALAFYQKSLKLNPSAGEVRNRIAMIEKEMPGMR